MMRCWGVSLIALDEAMLSNIVAFVCLLFSGQDYWPQDDPNHWTYYEDSQASQF